MAETNPAGDNSQPARDDSADAAEIDDGKVLAAIGYIPLLFLFPIVLKKENRFCRHHGKQALVLFGVEAVSVLILLLLGLILGRMGCAGNLVSSLLDLAFFLCVFILSAWGFIMAMKGAYWKMPVVAPLAEKMKI